MSQKSTDVCDTVGKGRHGQGKQAKVGGEEALDMGAWGATASPRLLYMPLNPLPTTYGVFGRTHRQGGEETQQGLGPSFPPRPARQGVALSMVPDMSSALCCDMTISAPYGVPYSAGAYSQARRAFLPPSPSPSARRCRAQEGIAPIGDISVDQTSLAAPRIGKTQNSCNTWFLRTAPTPVPRWPGLELPY